MKNTCIVLVSVAGRREHLRVCKRDKIQKSKVTQLYKTYYLVSGALLPKMSLTGAFCEKQKWGTLEKRKLQRDK